MCSSSSSLPMSPVKHMNEAIYKIQKPSLVISKKLLFNKCIFLMSLPQRRVDHYKLKIPPHFTIWKGTKIVTKIVIWYTNK